MAKNNSQMTPSQKLRLTLEKIYDERGDKSVTKEDFYVSEMHRINKHYYDKYLKSPASNKTG